MLVGGGKFRIYLLLHLDPGSFFFSVLRLDLYFVLEQRLSLPRSSSNLPSEVVKGSTCRKVLADSLGLKYRSIFCFFPPEIHRWCWEAAGLGPTALCADLLRPYRVQMPGALLKCGPEAALQTCSQVQPHFEYEAMESMFSENFVPLHGILPH